MGDDVTPFTIKPGGWNLLINFAAGLHVEKISETENKVEVMITQDAAPRASSSGSIPLTTRLTLPDTIGPGSIRIVSGPLGSFEPGDKLRVISSDDGVVVVELLGTTRSETVDIGDLEMNTVQA